jgi:Zn-dependent peptidase ImmA (M78 family)
MNDLTATIRAIISNLNIDPSKAVNFDEFSGEYNIAVKEAYIGTDNNGNEILGACKSKGLKKLVVVSPSIQHTSRKRFTIAHEIGHLYLHHGKSLCIATDFDFWNDKLMKESEANCFAAELLLPYMQCLSSIKKCDVSFSIVEKLARQYEVSLSATAIRLVKIDSGMSAVVAHDGAKVKWAIKSPDCRNGLVTVVDSRSLWQKAKGANSPQKESVDVSIWFNEDEDDDVGWVCEEETRYFKNLNSFLTIINVYEQ